MNTIGKIHVSHSEIEKALFSHVSALHVGAKEELKEKRMSEELRVVAE